MGIRRERASPTYSSLTAALSVYQSASLLPRPSGSLRSCFQDPPSPRSVRRAGRREGSLRMLPEPGLCSYRRSAQPVWLTTSTAPPSPRLTDRGSARADMEMLRAVEAPVLAKKTPCGPERATMDAAITAGQETLPPIPCQPATRESLSRLAGPGPLPPLPTTTTGIW
jgi:hypothetical protein